MPNNDSHQHVVKTSAQWNDRAVEYWVVPRGCLCVELTSRGKTKLKVGEGNKYYAQLPYICDIEDLSDYYTKEEINNLFNNLNRMAIMSTEEYDEKSDLPLTGNKLGDVRFVKSSSPSLKLDPDVYLWNGHKWIFVGYDIIDIDLSQYIKREEFEPVAAKVDEMYPKMHTHENKETLDRIEEPYTTAEKDKLDSLENYDDTEIRALIRQATHVHPNKSILDQIQQPFKNEDKTKLDSLENYDDTEIRDRISDVEAVAHTHSNKDELDSIYSGFVDEHQVLVEFKTVAEEEIDDLNNDVADLKTKIHTHSNKNILDSTTAPYTTQDKATLDELASITIFDGASPTYDGFRGYVPAPLAGQESYFLRGDGTWAMIESDIRYKAGAGISITDIEPIDTDVTEKEISVVPATTETIGGVIVGDGLEIDEEGVLSAPGGSDYIAGEGIDIIGTTRPIDINYIRLDINNSRDNGRGHIIQFRNIRVLDSNGSSLQFSHASSIYGDGSVVEYGQNVRDESPQAMIEGRNKTCCTNFSLTKAPLKITFTLTSEISIANITSFSILTGADGTERDPVSWDIYASNDGMTWYKIQEAHSPDVTTARSTWITNIPFVIPPDAVEVLPGAKTIKAKIGVGLTFDSNDAIELDDSIKLRLNCNNETN